MKTSLMIALILGTLAGIGSRFALNAGSEAAPGRESNAVLYWPSQVAAEAITEGAQPEVALRPELAGTIATVHVRAGQDVAEGTLLVELCNESQKHQVALARADVALAKAQLERLRNGEHPETRRAAAAVEDSRRVLYEQARSEYNRARASGGRSVSQEELDGKLFKMQQAEAEWKQAQADHALVEAPPREDELAAAEAKVAAAEARLRIAEADLAKTRLLAPSSGRILQVYAEAGELAGPGTTDPILVMADIARRRVRTFVEELDVGRVQVGQQAVVRADAFPDREFAGKVVEVVPRMGKRAPRSDAPGEYQDLYFREVLIELDGGAELPLNLRVQARIEAPPPREAP